MMNLEKKSIFRRSRKPEHKLAGSSQYKFSPGDEVVVQTVKEKAIPGTVKWVGPMKTAGEVVVPVVVGIETDDSITPNTDFPDLNIDIIGSDLGKHTFKVSDGHIRLYLPEALVLHTEEYDKQKEEENTFEALEAKKWGISVDEYREQKDMMEKAKTDQIEKKFDRTLKRQHTRNEEDENAYEQQDYSPLLEPGQLLLSPQYPNQNKEEREEVVRIHRTNKLMRQYSHPGQEPYHVQVDRVPGKGSVGDSLGLKYRPISLHLPSRNAEKYIGIPKISPDMHSSGFTLGSLVPVATGHYKNPLADKVPLTDDDDIPGDPGLFSKYIGDEHGIQGHHNSCYLDATVFGLFALSDSFDMMLLEEPETEIGQKIKHILWKGIVNPLRKYGLVRYESVMQLRNELENLLRTKGANKDERDPEEFLNLLFKEVLCVDPFLNVKRPFGIEEEFFVQLFLEIDPLQKGMPSTEQLIGKMFTEQHISLTQVPSKLLLQTPRFGKEFKMYNKIIPSLELDVRSLLDPASVGIQECYFCGNFTGTIYCSSCASEVFCTKEPVVFLCINCSNAVHEKRVHHKFEEVLTKQPIGDVSGFSKMQLLAVICIETCHYVCFTCAGDKWLFHDSMANRLYDMYNIPRVTDVTQELKHWVYNQENHNKLRNANSREVPECVRRFTQDIYMCVYVNPDLDKYGSPSDISLITSSFRHNNEDSFLLPHTKVFISGSNPAFKGLSEEEKEISDLKIQLEEVQNEVVSLHEEKHLLNEEIESLKNDQERLSQQVNEEKRERQKIEKEKVKLVGLLKEFEESWKVSQSDVTVTEQELGRGGWGIINVGVLNVAVKQLYKVVMSERNLALMQREINIMSKLRHPNLLLFIGAVLDHPSRNPLIITEIMDTSLRQAYEQGQLTDRSTKLSVLRDTAAGLNYLHCHPDEIIHRDVSSTNVLLESRGPKKWRAKLSDFGSANIACKAVTQAVGATVYCAPEAVGTIMIRERKPQTTKMDVFSYGVLMCEVITSSFPDPLKFSTMLERVTGSSPAIGQLIQSCISEKPQDRPTMTAVMQELNKQLTKM